MTDLPGSLQRARAAALARQRTARAQPPQRSQFNNRDRFTTRPRRVDPESSQSIVGQVAAQTPYTPPMPQVEFEAQQRRQYDALQQRPRAVEAYQEPRNQFAEAGEYGLEMTGLPSVRRSAAAFADNRPQEGFAEGAMGALSLATLGAGGRGARAPRPAPRQAPPPMRAPVAEPVPMPATPEPVTPRMAIEDGSPYDDWLQMRREQRRALIEAERFRHEENPLFAAAGQQQPRSATMDEIFAASSPDGAASLEFQIPVDYYYGQRLAPRSPDGGNGGAPPLEGEVLGPAGREMMAPRREITPAMVTEALRRGLPMMADAAEFEVRNIDAIIGAPDIRQIGGRFELFDKATGETVVRLPEGATFRDADRAVVSIIDLGLANNRAGQAALGAPRSPDGGNGSAGRTRLSAAGQDLARLRETAERSDLRGVVGDRQLRLARGQLAESSDSTWNDGTPMAMYQFPGGALTNVRIAQRGDGVREVNFSARGLRSGEASRADIESAFADALAAIERDAAANPGARYLLEGETPSHSRIYERLLTRANEIDGIVARRSGAGIEITIPDGPRQ